jgi:hypothetical protein
MRRLFGFLIPDLRLEMMIGGGGKRIDGVLLGPVELSKLYTTDGNIVVTSCQILMSAVILRLPGSRCVLAGWKNPGAKAHSNVRCVLRWTEVQLPLLKRGAPTEKRASADRGGCPANLADGKRFHRKVASGHPDPKAIGRDLSYCHRGPTVIARVEPLRLRGVMREGKGPRREGVVVATTANEKRTSASREA